MLTELTVQHELFGDGCSLRVGEQGVTRGKKEREGPRADLGAKCIARMQDESRES